MKERMNGDFELLERAIELLNSHTVMVSLIRVAKPAGIGQLTQEEKKPLRDALALLLEIRNNERKREQDEHAIAFAKEHKDSADPDTRRMNREFHANYKLYTDVGEEE